MHCVSTMKKVLPSSATEEALSVLRFKSTGRWRLQQNIVDSLVCSNFRRVQDIWLVRGDLMQTEAALNAINASFDLFGADQLSRLEPSKVKTFKLSGKFAYFQGGTAYHRIAVVCPLGQKPSHLQELLAGLVWANRVSNGQKTLLYLVGEGFSPVLRHLAQLFGPRVEVRLAYYTPKLNNPFLITGKNGRVTQPEYGHPSPRGLVLWERKFNPVEKGWFKAAIAYFQGFKEIEICCLDNWVSIKFKGLEVVRISKKQSRLRIALITRYPREILGSVGNREEKEGWFNTEGRLNSEFTSAFEQRIANLDQDHDLFARVCSDKQRLEYLISSSPGSLGLADPVFCQLEVGKKGLSTLEVHLLAKTVDGNLVTAVIHPQKDLTGFGQCLEQLIWSKMQFNQINRVYFVNDYLGDPEVWVICPQTKVHPDLEVIKSLLRPEERVKLVYINDNWSEKGIIPIRVY